jgi:hypothetical protein
MMPVPPVTPRLRNAIGEGCNPFSPRLTRSNRLAQHEPVAVGRPKRELTHAPWFVVGGLEYLCACRDRSHVERINVIDAQIRDIAVIAKLARGGNVGAATKHEHHLARATKPPIARVNVIELAPEDVAIPRTGPTKVMDGQNRIRARDLHAEDSDATRLQTLRATVARSTSAAAGTQGRQVSFSRDGTETSNGLSRRQHQCCIVARGAAAP